MGAASIKFSQVKSDHPSQAKSAVHATFPKPVSPSAPSNSSPSAPNASDEKNCSSRKSRGDLRFKFVLSWFFHKVRTIPTRKRLLKPSWIYPFVVVCSFAGPAFLTPLVSRCEMGRCCRDEICKANSLRGSLPFLLFCFRRL